MVEKTAAKAGANSECPVMMSRESNNMFTKGTIPSKVVNCTLGINVTSPGPNDKSMTGIRYACASLKLRAKEHNANKMALKNAAKITKSGNI